MSPNKSKFDQYYPKSDSLIISLPKNNKLLVLAQILFLTIFPTFAMGINYIKMHWWRRLSTPDIFKLDYRHMF